MPGAPQDECPIRAVPEPAEQEHHDEIAVGLCVASAVAAERNVKIVAQPRRQGHVPATPELGNRQRRIGHAEIARECESEHDSEPDRHVGIAGEIKIDLHGIGDQPDPRLDQGAIVNLIERDLNERRDDVGHQHLLGETDNEYPSADGGAAKREPAGVKLTSDRLVANDRPRDQLREERNVESDVDRIAVGPEPSAVDVDDVGQAVEGEKRDAERERNARPD